MGHGSTAMPYIGTTDMVKPNLRLLVPYPLREVRPLALDYATQQIGARDQSGRCLRGCLDRIKNCILAETCKLEIMAGKASSTRTGVVLGL